MLATLVGSALGSALLLLALDRWAHPDGAEPMAAAAAVHEVGRARFGIYPDGERIGP